jgi:hypothetical protein
VRLNWVLSILIATFDFYLSNAESFCDWASLNYELLGYFADIQLDPLPISTTNGTANSTAFSMV